MPEVEIVFIIFDLLQGTVNLTVTAKQILQTKEIKDNSEDVVTVYIGAFNLGPSPVKALVKTETTYNGQWNATNATRAFTAPFNSVL